MFTLFLLPSCNRSNLPSEGTVNAKVIEYKINYLEDKAGSIPTSILPGRMTLIFADNFALNRIDGFLGQFSLSYVADLKKKSVTTYLRLFDKKYYYIGQPGELPCGIEPLDNIQITPTGQKKEIAGYIANEIIVRTDDNKEIILYTASLDHIKNPNITTPYSEIKEVLLEFFTRLSVLDMRISASRLYNKEVDWLLFNIPEDYVQISKAEMEKAMHELFR